MNGWTRVNLSTQIIEIDNKNKYEATECRDRYILCTTLFKVERYSPNVKGIFTMQNNDR